MNLSQALANSSYVFETDIALIEKTATGKVIFYKGVGEPILAVSEQMDVYIDLPDGKLFVVVNRNFIYRFTFWSLTKIGSATFTAIGQEQVNIPAYQLKFKEVYDYLNENVFVGCCECGGGGSSDIVWLDTVEDLPTTGEVDKLYIVKSPFSAYIWNGTGYDTLSGGGGIESVVAGDDIVVDATDPLNPIVSVAANTFLRLSGTEDGFPVTNPIESTAGIPIYRGDLAGDYNAIFWNATRIGFIRFKDGFETNFFLDETSIEVYCDNPSFQGVRDASTNISNYTDDSLIKQLVLKRRLWSGSSDPSVSDDSFAGFVAGLSLWLNTTTGVIWKCVDDSAGAADWQVYYNPTALAALEQKTLPHKSRFVVIEQDFQTVATGVYDSLNAAAVSGGTQVSVNTIPNAINHPGVVALRDSTTANGGFSYGTNANILLGGGEHCQFVFQDRNTTTRATSVIRMGFQDSFTSTEPTDGVYLRIQGGVLRGRTRNNGVESNTATTFTVTQNTWYSCEITVNSTSLVTFVVRNEAGTILWTDTLTTNIPTAVGREIGFGVIAYETTTDAAADIMWLDYLLFEINRVLIR